VKLIKQEKISTQISDQYIWNFTVPENGVYVVSILARCKNWLQNYKRLFNDDDLAVQIDNDLFAEIKGKMREFTSPGSWNGNEIKGEAKNVLFLLPFKTGTHRIKFWVDVQPILEEIKIYKIDESEIDLMASNIFISSKFVDIISKNLKIERLEVKAEAEANSNLEIKIDGRTEKNTNYKRFEKWYWYGQELKGKSKDYIMPYVWSGDMHSIQMSGQGNPKIESIKLKINLEKIVYSSGFVKLYKDVVIRDDVNLRLDHTDESESLLMLRDGEKVEILDEKVVGRYIENLSEIWHEVIVRGIKGYVLSSYVEIDGQEREKIIDLIKEKSNQYGVDANLMLAIASQESHFKPFAKSTTGPMGIFQLSEDTRKRFGVEDPYDFYQSVAGGVQNYKDIERRTQVRGDILIKRLTAWHDGPTGTIKKINNRTFNYDKLSAETKKFIKNVTANLEKKDWYHIISLPIVIIFFASSLLISNMQEKIIVRSQEASVVKYDVLMNYKPEVNTYKNTSNYSSIFDFRKDESKDYLSYSPNVFFDEGSDQVIFLDSDKKVVGKIDPQVLNLDKVLGVTEEMKTSGWTDATHIGSVVLENPENVFYFSAINSYGCGANNCHWALYRFDAQKDNLKLINEEIFGQIMGLHLSPDLNHLAVVSGSTGGVCSDNDDLDIFNTTTFAKQEINQFNEEDKYGSIILVNFTWKKNNEVEFNVNYFKCPESDYLNTKWSYSIDTKEAKKLSSEIIYREL